MMPQIGIMQGRLLPPPHGRFQCFPRDGWEDEFRAAAKSGLACIEWIFDSWGEEVNPLNTDAGIARMKDLAAEHDVDIRSICADWFMDCPLIGGTPAEQGDRVKRLKWLIDRAARASLRRIVLPFVDASKIRPSHIPIVADILFRVLSDLRAAVVEVHLETDLAPNDFTALLNLLPADTFKVNYDTGNSASMGYKPAAEFAAYGMRIGSVHVKDRVRGGGTVPLGSGDADLESVFRGLRSINYEGDLILQVARSTSGDEEAWACANRRYVEGMLETSRIRPNESEAR
jgi:L-ribulose-5-phosphate 3-epimerase